MITKILVCLEGSPSSIAATNVAIETARRLAATVVGLAIVDEPDIRAGTPTSIGGASFKNERDETLVADARKQATLWLTAFADRCNAEGVSARTVEVVGRPACERRPAGRRRRPDHPVPGAPRQCDLRKRVLQRPAAG